MLGANGRPRSRASKFPAIACADTAYHLRVISLVVDTSPPSHMSPVSQQKQSSPTLFGNLHRRETPMRIQTKPATDRSVPANHSICQSIDGG